MSDAAKKCVDACTHPLVKGAALALLRAIADLIPEGQTTTPPVDIEDLAARARQHESTARRRRDLLVGIKEIRVLDGGQGRPGARYELVHLTGERPISPAPLPLVGAAPRRARTPKPADPTTPTLFEETTITPTSEDRAINFGLFARSTSGFLREVGIVLRAFCAKWTWRTKIERSTSGFLREVEPVALPEPAPLGVPIPDGLLLSTKKEEVVHVPEPSSVFSDAVASSEPSDDVRALLAWWLAEFPRRRNGARYTLKAWDARKAAELLKGRTFDHVQQMCILAMTWPSGGRDDWLATCQDFGLAAVLWKATLLDEEVRRLERDEARLVEMDEARAARAARTVEWEARQQEAVDAAEMAYVRLSPTDRDSLEREARDELKEWRPPRMTVEAFETAVHHRVTQTLMDRHALEQRQKFG